jgi:hypothetical protein
MRTVLGGAGGNKGAIHLIETRRLSHRRLSQVVIAMRAVIACEGGPLAFELAAAGLARGEQADFSAETQMEVFHKVQPRRGVALQPSQDLSTRVRNPAEFVLVNLPVAAK